LRSHRLSGLVLTMSASIIIAACTPDAPAAVQPAALPTATPATVVAEPTATRPAARPLTFEALKNTEYPSDLTPAKKVRLANGKYEEAIQPGAASKIAVSLSQLYAMGDLNGDGVDDAAVVLVSNTGGSGVFYQLVAVLNEGGTPKPIAATMLGDRVKLESLTIKSGEIVVEMLTQGPKDPLCCPSLKSTRSFRLQGDRLV